MILNAQLPQGPLAGAWQRYRDTLPLISPLRKRQFDILVVGTGLAGASAAATLAEQGYRVKVFTYHDSPRRAHSVAAQGGINAAKNYQNDGDSDFRLFADMLKGGDFRSRDANVYRLAELSSAIIDQCVAQGVPFAREYGGTLANRTFGGVLVSRTFYARGQTGQQLLYGAYGALMRQVATGTVELHTHADVLDLVTVDGNARGLVIRNLRTGELSIETGAAVLLCTGGYSNVYYLSTNAVKSNASATWRAHRRGAFFANPCFTQIHPTCIPSGDAYQSKLTLMSESLRNDGRVWVPVQAGDRRSPDQIPEIDRDYFLETRYPRYGNMVPRDIASRQAKRICDRGYGVGGTGRAVYLDFAEAIARDGQAEIQRKYGNLFDMYARISGEDPYATPMRIYPAPHYTMGGLWVDYNLMSNLPGLFVLGEANFSDHGANRLGASALMQGLADGYFIAPATVTGWLAGQSQTAITPDHPACQEALAEAQARIDQLLAIQGDRSVDSLHRELGEILLDACGISRDRDRLLKARQQVQHLQQTFRDRVRVPGSAAGLNPELEKALRLADFLELGELMIVDALHREESCGAHFREEHQTEDGEALRRDDQFSYVAAWEYSNTEPQLHRDRLEFKTLVPSQRNYQ
ncbi:fumarate reductase/succinate dehydrogenase flavoprotein subunit [Synechococcus elongatus]|uniref:fumarate reductase/succinate dehydrogenase flavoprotein subunit n=1 Tax=Synechococcus elongatus TaxID=32046 RepID=UPI000F7F59E9|nr:fumarate reductase/succinate dehydrogenase flavoprotein subunit [Synechococcus elongatus]